MRMHCDKSAAAAAGGASKLFLPTSPLHYQQSTIGYCLAYLHSLRLADLPQAPSTFHSTSNQPGPTIYRKTCSFPSPYRVNYKPLCKMIGRRSTRRPYLSYFFTLKISLPLFRHLICSNLSPLAQSAQFAIPFYRFCCRNSPILKTSNIYIFIYKVFINELKIREISNEIK